MKTKVFLSFALALAVGAFAVSCGSYDDSALEGRVKALEDKYAALEAKCQLLNDNVEAIRTAVSKIGESRYVQDVIFADGQYTILFTDGDKIVIKDGEKGDKGDSGSAPVVGVRKDTDDMFYWTVNGEWLLDESGKKVPVDAGQAIAPKFKVVDGWWYVSVYGDEDGYEKIEGSQTGDLIKVSQTDDAVYLTIGTDVITLPKAAGTGFKIVLEKYGSLSILAGGTLEVNYNIVKADESTVVVTECSGYEAEVQPSGTDKGKVVVKAPATLPASGYVIVKAVKNSSSEMSAQIMTFEEGVLTLLTDAVSVSAEGGEVEFKLRSNTSWTVNIPEADRSWITAWNTKAVIESTVVLTVAPNKGAARSSAITISDTGGSSLSRTLVVNQEESNVKQVSIAAAVNTKKVFWSDATITWTDVDGVSSYDMLLDGVKVASVDAGVQTYMFTGLSAGKDYVLNVAVSTADLEGKSEDLNITTATITKNTDNVGPTHLSFALQDVTGGGSTPGNRACQFQLSTTPDTGGLVYDINGFDGSLALGSTPYTTSSWLGKLNKKAVGIPLNVSFGQLNPGTTYYFRARTSAGYTMFAPFSDADVTVKATNGESEWSEWIAATTEPAHVAASNEVIYGGFDALSFNADFLNESCGIYPYVPTRKLNGTYATLEDEEPVRALFTWPWTGEWRVSNFSGPVKVYGWNIADKASYIDGSAAMNGYENLVFNDAAGDMKGWFVSPDFCPAMGTIMNRTTVAAGGHYVATPALNSALLSSTLKDCTLTFKACRMSTGTPSKEGDIVVVEVCRDGSVLDVTSVSLPRDIFLPETVNDNNNNVDYKFTDFSVDLQLKTGDSVIIKSGANTRFAIDEIKIIVK
ncbi:MAG: hypothetical protein IJ222_08650 [Bacteroidales bacterium]|nr:hypothetical protein [Bacteroidales bacterium]